MPGLPVHHQLPESTQTHVHWVGDAIQPTHPLSSPSPPAFIKYWIQYGASLASQVVLVKNLPANAGDIRDTGSVPGSGRSSGEGNGSPCQRSCLGNPMDRGNFQAIVPGVTESDMTEHTHMHLSGLYFRYLQEYLYIYYYYYFFLVMLGLLCSTQASLVVVGGFNWPVACGILCPDQGWNPHPLHWKADSLPPNHQGSHYKTIYIFLNFI